MKHFLNLHNPDLWIFLLVLCTIHGVSFQIMDGMPATTSVDSETYLGLAHFDFDQNVVRKYRVIIPFLAAGVHFLVGNLFDKIKPWSFPGDFGMSMSFLIVNNILVAYWGVLVYKFVRQHTRTAWAAGIGLLSAITCRWVGLLSGLPFVDSLYWVIVMWTLLGIKTQDRRMLMAAIFIGPWAKESFIFLAPIIFFFGPMPKKQQLFLFALSGLIVFSGRYLIDSFGSGSLQTALLADMAHLHEIPISLKRLFSVHGLYEIFSVTGFWCLLLIPAVIYKKLPLIINRIDAYLGWFIVSVVVHALLSTELARMLMLALPVLAVVWALCAERLLPEVWTDGTGQ